MSNTPDLLLSQFGEKFLGHSGALTLMDDLGTLAGRDGIMMMGGGNPSQIPSVQALFHDRMAQILDSDSDFESMIGTYDGQAGNAAFIATLADFFRSEYGWAITEKNISLTNGSQLAFFMLFNLFGGKTASGTKRRILFPLAPEYIGYEDGGIEADTFVAYRPKIEFLNNRLYKYRVDFEALEIDETIGAICVSRPTNPTGNVLTEDEIEQLTALAKKHSIPLIIDNAYGVPFPNIIYTDAQPQWESQIIMCMSLSKLGLPGARTGIVIGNDQIIKAFTNMNAILSLTPNSFGPILALELIRSRDILRLVRDEIKPHYEIKMKTAVSNLHQALNGTDYYIHKPEGAFFLWLWFKELPITCQTLYERLKARNVVVVPGHYFFPGLDEAWQHKHECIRLSYAGEPEVVAAGITILGQLVHQAYKA